MRSRVSGGWMDADPPFWRLSGSASALIYGANASEEERRQVQRELIQFLQSTIDAGLSTHSWLLAFRDTLITPWHARTRTITEDWEAVDEMIARTDPAGECGYASWPLRRQNRGSWTPQSKHIAQRKGARIDAVVLFGMNNGILPNQYDQRMPEQGREARRLFYVGVTRARKELHLVFTRGQHSPWVAELYRRTQSHT